MTDTSVDTARHGTRWRRAAAPFVLGLALTTAMATATMNSAFGFDATVKIINAGSGDGHGMSFSTNRLQATDAGFGMAPVRQSNGTWKNVLRAGFAGATMNGMCLSKTDTVGILGSYTVRIYSPSAEITANNGVFDLTDLVGDTTGTGINLQGSTQIGLSTADITTISTSGGVGAPYMASPFGQSTGDNPLDVWNTAIYSGAAPANWLVDGRPHSFGSGWTGIDAARADLSKVVGRLWQVQLSGNITLPNLSITVKPGTSNLCAKWPTEPNYTNDKSWP